MSTYGEWLRPFHRPGLESAGWDDEGDETPDGDEERGLAKFAYDLPAIRCAKHDRPDCRTCETFGGSSD